MLQTCTGGKLAQEAPGYPVVDRSVTQRDATFDSCACSTSDTLPLLANSLTCYNTLDSLPVLEMEALLNVCGPEKSALAFAADGKSQERFEFDTPPIFHHIFEEQECIDGYLHMGWTDITVGDVNDFTVTPGDVNSLKRPPAGLASAVEKLLQGRLPAQKRSRFLQILDRGEEGLDAL